MNNPLEFERHIHRPRTVLVTGASGVVGQALLPRLMSGSAHRPGERPAAPSVLGLVHHRDISEPGVKTLRGSVTSPLLGLSPTEYEALAHRVDVIVHSAAVVSFNPAAGAHAAINVDGTREVLTFAARAQAPVVHVSTAYLHAEDEPGHRRKSVRYAESKRAAEDLVRASGVPHTIVRPSIVMGASGTGEISDFQGLYQVVGATMQGMLPILPFERHWPLDLIPCDVVADAIATVVERNIIGRELWLTAGDRALTIEQVTDVLVEHARRHGIALDKPRFVAPEMYYRLIAPVFLGALPRGMQKAVTSLMEMFLDYVSMEDPFPSSLAELAGLGGAPLTDSRANLANSLGYWHAVTRESVSGEAVA